MRHRIWWLVILGLTAAALWLGTNPLGEFRDNTGASRPFPGILGDWRFAALESTFPAASRISGGTPRTEARDLDGSRLHLDAGMIRWTSPATRAVAGPVTYRSFPDHSTAAALPGAVMQALGRTPAGDSVQGTFLLDARGDLLLVQGGMRYRWTRPDP